MPRNNGWLAILAVSVVLSILRNSLAGERYPLNYGNAEPLANRSKSAYEPRASNRPPRNSQNHPQVRPKSLARVEETSGSGSIDEQTRVVPRDGSKTISHPVSKITEDPSIPRDVPRGSNPLYPLGEARPAERSNKLRTIGAGARAASHSTGSSLEIPRETGSARWISRDARKDSSKGTKRATHRLGEPCAARSRKTTSSEPFRRGNGFAGLAYTYHGPRGEHTLTPRGKERNVGGRGRFTGDLSSTETERSDRRNSRETVGDIENRDIGSRRSSWNVDKVENEFDVEGYSTGGVKGYESYMTAVSGERELNLDELKFHGEEIRKGLNIEKDDRSVFDSTKGKRRSRRSVRGKNFKWRLRGVSNDLETEYDSRLFSSVPRNGEFDAERPGREGYYSSRFEGFQSTSRKSGLAEAGNVDGSDTLSSELRSTMEVGDQKNDELEYFDSNRGKGRVVPNSTKIDGDSPSATPNDTVASLLGGKINDEEKNIKEMPNFGFTGENRMDGLSNDENFNPNTSDGNDAKLELTTLILNDVLEATTADQTLSDQEIMLTDSELGEDTLLSDDRSNFMSFNISEDSVNDISLDNSTNGQLYLNDARLQIESSIASAESTLFSSGTATNSLHAIEPSDSLNYSDNDNSPTTRSISTHKTYDISYHENKSGYPFIDGEPVPGEPVESDAQSRAATVPASSDEPLLTIPDVAKHSINGEKLEASWSRTDEPANRSPSKDPATLSNATKEAGNVLPHSSRGLIAVPENAAYLRRDMNSLADKGFSDVVRFDARNADDPSRNSSSRSRKEETEGNVTIITDPRWSSIDRKEQADSSKVYQSNLEPLDEKESNWSPDLRVDNYEERLKDFPIVHKDENSRFVESSNESNIGEIKDNEPADNETANRIDPDKGNGTNVKDTRDFNTRRLTHDFTNRHSVKGRKSRRTSTRPEQDGDGRVEKLASVETFGEVDPRGGDSTSNIVQDIPVSTALPQRVRDVEGTFSNENATISSTEVGTLINGEYQSYGSDTIVSSLEPSDEDFRVTDVNDVDAHGTGNSSNELEPPDQWPVKHNAVVEGDLVLGGLMMVHEREDTITCGPVMPQGGVQALEAMLYTLDMLNDRGIVPGVKIGAHILDDCDKDTYGLEMAVDFIKGSISNIDGAEYHCNKTAVRKVISGVVGAASSVTSIQVANLLRLFRIPQVSFFSTSPELSNKHRFEYFTRTIPSDHYQVKAMVDIVLTMGWSYVSIIYEESNYGIKAFEELEDLLGKYDICIAIKEKLVKDSGVAEETAYDNIVLKLLTKPRARGCIIFGSDQEVAGVMRAVRRCNATGAFSWIGSDGWSARGLVSNGNEAEVEGTLSVQPQANPVKGFEEYFLNLTVENNRRNPWFVEFWEDHFQCRYPNASKTPYNQKYTRPCTTKERLTKQDTAFEDQLQFVSDAVMAFAYAFRDMHKDLCHGKPGLCDAMKPTRGMELLKYLRKVDFEGLSGDKFKFDKNGDGPARYNIIHFKQIEPGKYKWIRVGKYLEGELRLNMSEIQFKLGHPQPPESVCSLPCEVGQAKKYVEGERCCWHCFNCTQYQIRHPKDETQCIPCRQGTVPDETHSTCRDIPEEFLRPESGWAIGAMSFSSTGILITMFVCGVFLKHNDTPVVRASGRELSYVLLSGILLCYLVTFALVLRPTDIVCGIQRFAAGFCFTVVYASLLTKTNRISRIFNASKHSAKRPSFISPRSQLIICSGLVFVQILINGVWMIIDPARAMHHYPTREDNLLVCNSYVDASYMIAFAYPIMLIVVCTVYAVLTRKIPEAFNESKHIGFTMYTTCVIWLAFVPLYFGTGNNVALRITSMSVTISLSASVTIACLFSPKLYIILIRPERNVRQSMMPARYGTTKSSAVTATNASSMIAPVTLTAATCDQNKTVKKHIIATIDCSTQSEYYELEVKDQKNGKPQPTVVSRATQTSGNDKESNLMVASKDTKEDTTTTKQLNNNARIGNGPVSQNDVPL